MDRTILHNTTILSHKKTNDCEKFTESILCDEIHDNLRTLGLILPFNDELRDVFEKVSDLPVNAALWQLTSINIDINLIWNGSFSKGMFIKPNAKAFPHVMKYLLTICDANEFKKKFCWPIYNKAAEATFR